MLIKIVFPDKEILVFDKRIPVLYTLDNSLTLLLVYNYCTGSKRKESNFVGYYPLIVSYCNEAIIFFHRDEITCQLVIDGSCARLILGM